MTGAGMKATFDSTFGRGTYAAMRKDEKKR